MRKMTYLVTVLGSSKGKSETSTLGQTLGGGEDTRVVRGSRQESLKV
jgi:hypothetical protein